jgi:hypothetical protein
MLPLEAKEQETEQKSDWIRRTSQKILAVGAGLVAFLKYTARIFISPEPCHEPDQAFINELVELLQQLPPASRPAGDD